MDNVFKKTTAGDAKNFSFSFIKSEQKEGLTSSYYAIRGAPNNAICPVQVDTNKMGQVVSANAGVLIRDDSSQFPFFSMMFIEIALIEAFEPKSSDAATKSNMNAVFTELNHAESRSPKKSTTIKIVRHGIVWSKNYVNDGKYHGVIFQAERNAASSSPDNLAEPSKNSANQSDIDAIKHYIHSVSVGENEFDSDHVIMMRSLFSVLNSEKPSNKYLNSTIDKCRMDLKYLDLIQSPHLNNSVAQRFINQARRENLFYSNNAEKIMNQFFSIGPNYSLESYLRDSSDEDKKGSGYTLDGLKYTLSALSAEGLNKQQAIAAIQDSVK